MSSETEEELWAELKKQEALIKKLSDQINPPPRPTSTWQKPDPTEGMSMPANAMRAMIDAVPESLMAEIRGDARKPNPMQASSSPLATTSSAQSPQPQPKGTGWREAAPLTSPAGSGQKYIDAIVDAADRSDQVELARRLAETEIAMRAMKENK